MHYFNKVNYVTYLQVSNGSDVTKESTPSSGCNIKYTEHCVTQEMIQELLHHDKVDDKLVTLVKNFREMLCCDIHPASPDCNTKNVHTLLQAEGCVAKLVELLKCSSQWVVQVCMTLYCSSCCRKKCFNVL